MPRFFISASVLLLAACMGAAWPSNAAQALTHGGQASAVSGPLSEEAATARANAILAQMTLEEKAAQVSQQFMFGDPAEFEPFVRNGGGSLLFVTDPAVINRLQRVAVEESRLHVPLLFGFDVIHGLRTIFPVPIALAASWDPSVAERSQAVAAAEARASGITWTFAPMVDVTRDPRWGRIVEGAGEDPYLGAAFARAQVHGFQGGGLGSPGHVISGPKHFATYGASEGGRDYDAVHVSESQFYNVYLPPFAAAVEAGAGNIMSAYMEINDVPAAGNPWLLRNVLREELGFKGFVVSDANGVKSLQTQGFASDEADAAVRAMNAGNDMEMSIGANAYATLVEAVRGGRVSEATLDDSVRRVLVAKFRMGLFENPYVDETKTAGVLADPAHRQVARMAAERSLVLMRNEGGVLPLQARAGRRLAVIGPMADSRDDMVGSWVFAHDQDETVSIFEGLRDKVGSTMTVETAPGVQLSRHFPSMFDAFAPVAAVRRRPALWAETQASDEFERAVALARASDVVVMVLGETQSMTGERASRSALDLPGDQQRLLDAVAALGKPIVLVLLNGRPLDIGQAATQASGVLEAWYPGTEGGRAIADALFGDVNPGGKLPMTWPRSVGQIPVYYSQATTKAPDDADERYWDVPSTPLYPFGFGLSYTTFSFSNLRLERSAAHVGETITVTVDVANTGSREGDEVAQLYIHQKSGRATRPRRELKGFQRVTLAPGEVRTVTFTLGEAELRYWSTAEHRWVVDAANFDIWVGSDSNAQLHADFSVALP